MINSDVVRSAAFVELRRLSAELKSTLTEPLSMQHEDHDARDPQLERDRDRDRGARRCEADATMRGVGEAA